MAFLKIENSTRLVEVDDEDFERLSKYKWYYHNRTIYRTKGYPTIKSIPIHKEILNVKYLRIDHIDRCEFNCKKSNLRFCTQQQNCFNRSKRKGSTSKYKGVYWNKKNRKWKSTIGMNGSKIHLGVFDNEVEAAKAYDIKAKELFGEFAFLNFQEESDAK